MTIKKHGRQLGRLIRRKTGLALPVAMRIGKKVAQGNGQGWNLAPLFPGIVTVKWWQCGDGCCAWDATVIQGPKGKITGMYELTDTDIVTA